MKHYVKVIKQIISRSDRRKITQEIKRNTKGLKQIEDYFLLTAQKEGIDNYNEVFEFFKKEWKNECRRIIKQKKLVYTIPNFDMFDEKYKDLKDKFKSILKDGKQI